MAEKKKKGKIWLVVLLVVLVGLGWVLVKQANNIKALQLAQYTEEEQQALAEQNEAAVQEILEKMEMETMRVLTEEEQQKLESGEISEEEALQLIMGTAELSEGKVVVKPEAQNPTGKGNGAEERPEPTLLPETSGKPNEGGPVVTSKPEATENTSQSGGASLQQLLAKVYLLRGSFTGQLNGLVAQAKQEYIASRGKADKAALVSKYIGPRSGVGKSM